MMPLSGDRPSTAEAPCPCASISWAGCGVIAFAGFPHSPHSPEASEARAECHRVEGLSRARGLIESLGPSVLSKALEEFFEHGGRCCRVLADPRFRDTEPGWLGEDAGPGYSSGLFELVEREDVGTVVLTGRFAPRMQDSLLWLASRREDLLFVVEGWEGASGGGGEPALRFPRSNVVALVEPEEGGDGVSPGALAAWLESTDFQEEPAFAVRPEPPLPGVSADDALRLRAWRRFQGLRRSLDLGTRWVLFELNHPLLWRRVEREVTAFLRRLEKAGFLARRGGQASFSVNCGPTEEEWETGIGLRVVARLEDPYGSILESPLEWIGIGNTGGNPEGELLPGKD